MYSLGKSLQHKQLLGFSLIEVLITSAIIGIVTGIAVIRYGAFNSSVTLRNQAYEVALSIREAQVFSISVRSGLRKTGGSVSVNNFREPYGIHFDLRRGPTQQYVLFADTSGNQSYNSGEGVATSTIDSRFEIFDVCVGDGTDSNCYSDGTGLVDDLSIAFKRPDFDAHLTASGDTGTVAQVKLRAIGSNTIFRTITIRGTGQISVD